LGSSVVQAVTNDTNIQGSISAQNLTFSWAGTLAASRLNGNVVQAITNDTNVTGSIAAQNLTLGWTGTLGLARGGTNANLSATGGAGQYLKQVTSGAAVTVGTIPASDIASGTALTRTDDTNVTLTLGGTPATALLGDLAHGWLDRHAGSKPRRVRRRCQRAVRRALVCNGRGDLYGHHGFGQFRQGNLAHLCNAGAWHAFCGRPDQLHRASADHGRHRQSARHQSELGHVGLVLDVLARRRHMVNAGRRRHRHERRDRWHPDWRPDHWLRHAERQRPDQAAGTADAGHGNARS
jgi:hypothetical protein